MLPTSLSIPVGEMKVASPTSMVFPGKRRFNGLARFVVAGVALLVGLFYIRHITIVNQLSFTFKPLPKLSTGPQGDAPHHPIDTLIAGAEKTFEQVLKRETHNVHDAAQEYRRRRGRHPPPGFDIWFSFAKERGALIVEDFFDQIYDDLGPFWGVDAALIRKESSDSEMVISIRNGKARTNTDWMWTVTWTSMTETIESYLPDLDMPLNPMDESRVLAWSEDITRYMEREKAKRRIADPKHVVSEYQRLSPVGENDVNITSRDKKWQKGGNYWEIARRGCPPDSLARTAELEASFDHDAIISPDLAAPHMYQGYVSNFTLSTEICHQPDLQSLHGTMIEPLSISTTEVLTPIFGGSKLLTNNDILLPPAAHWDPHQPGVDFLGKAGLGLSWAEKYDSVIWRGVGSGGRNRENNWKGFQRHRLVSQTNGTQVALVEAGEAPMNWAMPSKEYHISAMNEGRLGEWMDIWSDTGFIGLSCFPSTESRGDKDCPYTSPYFDVLPKMDLAEQFTRKYMPDVDGNSFSGRFRSFLLSGSIPIKATIYREWHDSRLLAWKHFVPMDNRFLDFYGIMEYFLGYRSDNTTVPGHDAAAKKIALEGQAWANRVLRQEDMQIYMLRLLLEYARISDERRENMGWVGDLI